MDPRKRPSRSSTSALATEPAVLSRRAAIGLLVLSAAGLLSGCAAMKSLSSEVSSFGTWPTTRAPGAYAFERLPSQKVDVASQDKIEAAAEPALAEAGFVVERQGFQTDAAVAQDDGLYEGHAYSELCLPVCSFQRRAAPRPMPPHRPMAAMASTLALLCRSRSASMPAMRASQ